MKKKIVTKLAVCCFLLAIASESQALMVASEPIVASPSSTENLWSYSYLDYNSTISSAAFYYTNTSQFSAATYQGYLTGDFGPWSATTDSFYNPNSDIRDSHIFETYIMSSVAQTVWLRMGGDDGHSIFVDDVFVAGAGYAVTATGFLAMDANVTYKLTTVLSNYTGPWSSWFTMADQTGQLWGGPVSEARNISMNATGDFDAVPEPATMLLFGTGLVGLAGFRLRKKKQQQ